VTVWSMWSVILRSPLIVTPSNFKKGTRTIILADNGGMTRLPGPKVVIISSLVLVLLRVTF